MKSKSKLNMEIEALTNQCESYKDKLFEANQILDRLENDLKVQNYVGVKMFIPDLREVLR